MTDGKARIREKSVLEKSQAMAPDDPRARQEQTSGWQAEASRDGQRLGVRSQLSSLRAPWGDSPGQPPTQSHYGPTNRTETASHLLAPRSS